MSRIGKKEIAIPEGVTITLAEGFVTVKGPRGELKRAFFGDHLDLHIVDSIASITRKQDTKQHKSFHGLMRTLIANMVIGVTTGFTKTLLMKGVGYKAELKGNDLVVNVGFSHPVNFPAPEGISFVIEDATTIKITGESKELVGQLASNIRKLRKPEPYKGKGIFYVINGVPEYIARKEGKRASG